MIIHGYSEKELKKLPDNSVDLIIKPQMLNRRTEPFSFLFCAVGNKKINNGTKYNL